MKKNDVAEELSKNIQIPYVVKNIKNANLYITVLSFQKEKIPSIPN